MEDRFIEEDVKHRLILSGLQELEERGVEDFSLRRAAIGAQVSCAAPYRHFKSKEEYIGEVVRYIESRWDLMAREIESVFASDKSRLVAELCVASLRFRITNRNFRTPLTLNDGNTTDHIDSSIARAVSGYCREKGLSPEEEELRRFVAVSLISGAVVTSTPENRDRIIELTRKKITEEFP